MSNMTVCSIVVASLMLAFAGGAAAQSKQPLQSVPGKTIQLAQLFGQQQRGGDSELVARLGQLENQIRQLTGMVRPGDCLVALSTSGESENVVRACHAAREAKGRVIGLTGVKGGRVAAASDVAIQVPENDTPLVQEVHLTVVHLLCEMVEDALFPRTPGAR